MIGASLYIVWCSARNRIRVRLRRLREPRYLIGAIVGIAYLYFTVFARSCGRRTAERRRGRPETQVALTAFAGSGPAVGGIVLLAVTALTWLFPGDSGTLAFTDAETQFLFTAPVSRRALIVHRLLRSQLGVLFAALVPALVFPSGGVGPRLRLGVALWMILTTLRVHFTGVTLMRSSLAVRGGGVSRLQWWPLAVIVAAVAVVGRALAVSFRGNPVFELEEFFDRIAAVTSAGLPAFFLWPFAALAKPLFAAWPGPFLAALAGAAIVLAVNVWWVLTSDAALQDATARADERRAAREARERPVARVRATSWTLPLTGPAETLFVWKNAMQMLRESSTASLLRYGAPMIGMTVALTSVYMSRTHMRGAAVAIGAVAAMIAAMAVLLGPQMARTDLRQDLLHLELLKTWPLRAAAVIRGEMIWPGLVVTSVAWMAIACATVLWTPVFLEATLADRLAVAAAAAVLAPALVYAQFTIHNAAAVVFPAWVPLGTGRPKGIDAMGQRLLLFAGIILGLVVMMAPGAIAGFIVWFAFRGWIGMSAFLPAAVVCTAIVLVEILATTEALGPVYEQLDLSAVERSE